MEDTRILIVDDEESILDTFSMSLESRGYYVKTASGSDDALRLIAESKFHIAFVDQFLGSAKGLELIQLMADVDPELYYVIITASASTDLAVEALKKGASDFIVKPFRIADLIRSIDYVNKKRDFDSQKKELISMLKSEVKEKTEELKEVYFSVLSSLAQAMEKRDVGTYLNS